MADIVVEFLQSFIKSPYFLVLFVSMFPLIELKGAIPIGLKLGLNLPAAALISYVGSTLIVIPIFFLLEIVFKLLKKIPIVGKLFAKIEAVFVSKAETLAKKSDNAPEKLKRRFLMTALFVFVSLPLPLTGVWTGAALAVFTGMRFKDSIIPLALGNLVAGTLITLITFLFKDYVNYVISVILVIAIIMLVVLIVKIAVSKPRDNKE